MLAYSCVLASCLPLLRCSWMAWFVVPTPFAHQAGLAGMPGCTAAAGWFNAA